MDVEQKILRVLFEDGRMNYRSIVDLGIHPNIARRELDRLKEKGFVKEEGREIWKRGKPLFYCLTEKGEETFFNMTLESLNETLKIIERMLGKLLSKPDRIEKWREIAHEKWFREPMKITESMPLEEIISLAKEKDDKISGPLKRVLWLIHRIVIKVWAPIPMLPKNENMFIRITERGGIWMIPEAVLRGDYSTNL